MKNMDFVMAFVYGYAYCKAESSKKEGLFSDMTTKELALIYIRESCKGMDVRKGEL